MEYFLSLAKCARVYKILPIVPAAGHFPDKIRGCSGFLDFDRQYELLGPSGPARI